MLHKLLQVRPGLTPAPEAGGVPVRQYNSCDVTGKTGRTCCRVYLVVGMHEQGV